MDQGQGTSWIEKFKDRIVRAFDSAGSVDSWKAQIYGFIIGTSTKTRISAKNLTNATPLDVSIVDGSGNQVTSFGGGTQYTEGDVDTTITGTAMLGEAASSTLQPIQLNASNHLKVDASGTAVPITDNSESITVDNAGTFAVQATIASGATSIAKAEDVASADSDVGVPAMAVRKATPANTSGTDGDYEMLQMSAGRLWTSATIDAALPAGANAIGKLAANSGVDIGDVDILSIAAGDNNIGNVDIVTVPAPLSTTGGGTEATALRVTIANDSTGVVSVDDNGSSLTVDGTVTSNEGTVSSATLANVASSASSVTLIASNASRKRFMIFNDSTENLYVKFGATASTSSFTVKILPDGYYEAPSPCYTGVVDGIWSSANGSARTTEL